MHVQRACVDILYIPCPLLHGELLLTLTALRRGLVCITQPALSGGFCAFWTQFWDSVPADMELTDCEFFGGFQVFFCVSMWTAAHSEDSILLWYTAPSFRDIMMK